MYIVISHYKVPSNMRKRYLELVRKTADLHEKHGYPGYEVSKMRNAEATG